MTNKLVITQAKIDLISRILEEVKVNASKIESENSELKDQNDGLRKLVYNLSNPKKTIQRREVLTDQQEIDSINEKIITAKAEIAKLESKRKKLESKIKMKDAISLVKNAKSNGMTTVVQIYTFINNKLDADLNLTTIKYIVRNNLHLDSNDE